MKGLSLPLGMQYSNDRFRIINFTRDMSLGAGSQTIIGVGWTPKSVLILALIGDTAEGSIGIDDLVVPRLIGTSGGGHATTKGNWEVGATSSARSIVCYGISGLSNSIDGRFTSFNSDGGVIAWTIAGAPTGLLQCTAMFLR